jgi:hypothetical protein
VKNVAWYGLIGVFAVVGVSVALLNGAGFLFGLGLIGFAVMLHLVWLGVGELRQIRLLSEAQLETQRRTHDLLDWSLNVPQPLEPQGRDRVGS